MADDQPPGSGDHKSDPNKDAAKKGLRVKAPARPGSGGLNRMAPKPLPRSKARPSPGRNVRPLLPQTKDKLKSLEPSPAMLDANAEPPLPDEPPADPTSAPDGETKKKKKKKKKRKDDETAAATNGAKKKKKKRKKRSSHDLSAIPAPASLTKKPPHEDDAAATDTSPPPPPPAVGPKTTAPPPPPPESKATAPPPPPPAKAAPPAPQVTTPPPAARAHIPTAPRQRLVAPRAPAQAPEEALGPVPQPAEPNPEQQHALDTVRACEAILAESPPPARRRAGRLHYEIARLCDQSLHLPVQAEAHLRAALEHMPDHRPALRALRHQLRRQQRYDEAVDVCVKELRLASDRKDKAALLFDQGVTLDRYLGRLDEALKAFEAGLELTPEDLALHDAIASIHRRRGDLRALAQLYDRSSRELSDDPRHRAAMVTTRAELGTKLGEHPDAVASLYAEATRLDVDAAAALAQLGHLRHGLAQWQEYVGTLKQKLHQLASPEERVRLLHRIATLASERLGDDETALQALNRATAESPNHPMVLSVLAAHFENQRQWSELVETLAALVEVTQNPRERLGVHLRIGQLCQEVLDDTDAAIAWYEQARHTDPTYVPALQALAKLYAAEGRWEDLLRLHVDEAATLATDSSGSSQPRRRAAAHARIGEILERRLGRVDEAIEHHLRALALFADYAPAFKALERILPAEGRYRDLVALYEEAIERAPDPDRVTAFLFKIGGLFEDQLAEPDRAMAVYRRLMQRNPHDIGALQAFQRAAASAERWHELVDALQKEALGSDDEEHQAGLMHRAGEVCDDKLGEPDEAIRCFTQALTYEPRYVPSLTALGRIYYRLERWEDLLEMYRRELEVTPYGPGAVSLLVKMGELYEERVGDSEAALGCYREALTIDPSTGPALSIVSRKLEQRQDYETLAQVLELALTAESDPRALTDTLWRLGTLYEERLDDDERALECFRRATQSDGSYHPAYVGIERILSRQGRYRELIAVLADHATTTASESVRRSCVLWSSRLHADHLDDLQTAADLLAPLVDADPPEPLALMRLEALYEALGDDERLSDLFDAQADAFVTGAARAAALKNLAQLQLAQGAPGARSTKTLRLVLKLSPGDAWSITTLTDRALVSGDASLLTDLEAQGRADPTVFDPEIRLRLGELLEEREPEVALAVFRAALRDDPESLAAARGLARSAERLGRHELWLEGLLSQARSLVRGGGAARALVAAARVMADHLDDATSAVGTLFEALRADPNSAEAVEELVLRALDRRELADRLAEVAREASPERATTLWLVVADQLLGTGDDVPPAESQLAARRALSRAQNLAPDNAEVLLRKARLEVLTQDWKAAAESLERVLELAPDGPAEAEAHLQLAELYSVHLGDQARGQNHADQVMSRRPQDFQVLERVLDIHERSQRWQAAQDIVANLLSEAQTPTDKGRAQLRAAKLMARRGDDAGALVYFGEGVAQAGPFDVAQLGLDRWVHQQPAGAARYQQALATYIEGAEAARTPSAEAYLTLARLQGTTSGAAAATITLQRGLAACGDHLGLRLALAEALASQGSVEEATTELREYLATHPGDTEAWRALVRVFDASGERLGAHAARQVVALLAPNVPEAAPVQAPIPSLLEAQSHGVLNAESQQLATVESPAQLIAGQIVGLLRETIAKRNPPNLAAHGVTGRDALPPTAPLKRIANAVGRAMGVADPSVFVSDQVTAPVLEPTAPVAILLPSSALSLSETRATFVIARLMAPAARRLEAVISVPPRQLELLVAAATRLYVRNFGNGLTSEGFLEELGKEVGRTVSRRARRVLEELASKHANARRMDFDGWRGAVDATAVRAAVMCAGDFRAAVTMLVAEHPELARFSGEALFARAPQIANLATFWVSSTALSLRRRALQ